MTEAEFVELLSIVDRSAGREHSRDGRVAATLLAVLERYDEMRGVVHAGPMLAARALLGRDSIVTISKEPLVLTRGRLMSVSEAGEVGLLDEDGFMRWCWPMLDIREACPRVGMHNCSGEWLNHDRSEPT